MEINKSVRQKYFWDNELSFFDNISSRLTYLVIFLLVLFFVNLGKRDLWAPDEPRYAEAAREMRNIGDYVLPHLNNESYPDKPPVLFWLINLFSTPFGKVTELTARFPSALSGFGCAIIIYFLGIRLFSAISIKNPHRIGFLAALILTTSIEFIVASRRVSFDVLLTFLITFTLFSFHTGYTRNKGKTKFFFLAYLIMSIATITKGPVAIIVPILIITTFLIIEKYKNPNYNFRIRDMHIGLGIIILFSIPLLWVYGIYSHAGWEHTKEVVFTQNAGRTVNSWSHNQPFYYYLINFPLRFMPWTIFIPSVVIYFYSVLKKYSTKNVQNTSLSINDNDVEQSLDTQLTATDIRTTFRFPFVWFAVIFIFFSAMSGKRTMYILPLYPAASLFVAWFLNEFISNPNSKIFKRIGFLPFKIAYGILIILGIGIPTYVFISYNYIFYTLLPLAIVFIIGQIISLRFLLRKAPFKSLISSFIVFLLTVIIGTQTIIPILNERKSAKHFSLNMQKIVGNNGQLVSYKFFGSTYLFYSGRKHIELFNYIDKLKDYMESNEQVFVLLKEYDFGVVKNKHGVEIYELLKESVGHKIVVLASNKPLQNDHNWGFIYKDFPLD